MVGDHDHRLLRQTAAAQLHRRRRHFEGLAGADLVRDEGGRLVEHPSDRGRLVRVQRERLGQPLRLHRCGGVVALDQRVEHVVVRVDQAGAAVAVLPQPPLETLTHLLDLLLRSLGAPNIGVLDAVNGVGDLRLGVVQDRLSDLVGGATTAGERLTDRLAAVVQANVAVLVGVLVGAVDRSPGAADKAVTVGAGPLDLPPPGFGAADLHLRVVHEVGDELAHVLVRNPRGAHLRLDPVHADPGRHLLLQRLHVGVEGRVHRGSRFGYGQPGTQVTGEVTLT